MKSQNFWLEFDKRLDRAKIVSRERGRDYKIKTRGLKIEE